MPLAILHIEGARGSADTCAEYKPHFSSIPMTLANTPKFKIFLPTPSNGCDSYNDNPAAVNSSAFITGDGNCTQNDKYRNAYHGHAKQAIIIADRKAMKVFSEMSKDEYKQIHIQVGMIADLSWLKVKELGEPLYAQLYHPHDPIFDPNLIVIWLIAVFTVCTGAYWCGKSLEKSLESDDHISTTNNADDEVNNFPITTVMVVVFVLMICTVLLLLYFFYKYLIYVVLFLFAIASISGTYECLSALMSFLDCGRCRVPENNIPILKDRPEVRNIILFLFCVGLSITWVIVRNESYSWILQDFLGICFCISLIKLIRLPNLKISAMLLMALLVYDIFFVFITPFFSAHGKSVMVEVATGNGSNEHLPMVIKVPKIIKSVLSLCERPYSLLGFGDILLPGLFVAFCHNFDVIAKTKYRVYFVATSIAYGIGLAATFVALILMKIGQPALLYLAPSVLLACVIVGALRGELSALWKGRVDVATSAPPTDAEQQRPLGGSISDNEDLDMAENRKLLNDK